MAYAKYSTVPDDLIRARLREAYAAAEPSGVRPSRDTIMKGLHVDWDRVKVVRDAMVEAKELPDLKPNTGGSVAGKRAGGLAKARAPAAIKREKPAREKPAIPRSYADISRETPPAREAWRKADQSGNRYQRPAAVMVALAAERELRVYGEVLRRRIAERELEATT
jgi:hypothetical protein